MNRRNLTLNPRKNQRKKLFKKRLMRNLKKLKSLKKLRKFSKRSKSKHPKFSLKSIIRLCILMLKSMAIRRAELKWTYSLKHRRHLRTLERFARERRVKAILVNHSTIKTVSSIELSLSSWLKVEISLKAMEQVANQFMVKHLKMRTLFTSMLAVAIYQWRIRDLILTAHNSL